MSAQSTIGPLVGINIDDVRRGIKPGLRLASSLGFPVVELTTVAGDLAPSNLSLSGRRHLRRIVDGLGLQLASLAADFPQLRFSDPRTVGERVERSCEVIELAADLKVPVVTASAGRLTVPNTREPSPLVLEALRRIGEFADSRGTIFGIRPSYDGGDRLVGVMDNLACPFVGVGLDPAALVMTGADPLERIERFVEQIVAVQARDGTVGGGELAGHETPLGDGDVDWPTLLAVLRAAEYRRPFIVRRTGSANPGPDLLAACDALKRMLGRA
ncbi:MAG: sugar phosphate isomerase/epimerase family protein [Phycisphaerae bacterium]